MSEDYTFKFVEPTLEQAIADLQTWLKEDGENCAEVTIERGHVDVWLWGKYGHEARIVAEIPPSGDMEKTIEVAITQALKSAERRN